MKVIDFNGNTCNWPPTGKQVAKNDRRPRSEYHLRARELLRSKYPTQAILEEVPLPGTGLFLDFYIPSAKLAIEVQGQQHTNYTPHFHGSKFGFEKSKQRDTKKKEWCDMNNISLIEFEYNKEDNEWQEKLNN